MKSKLLALALTILPVASFAADIAFVNFNSIKGELREHYFAKPENAEIKNQFNAALANEKKRMTEYKEAMAKGNLKKAQQNSGVPESFFLEKKINIDIKKDIYLIISKLGLKYGFIYDSSEPIPNISSSIIYAKSPIDDITETVKQAFIDDGKTK